MTRTASQDSAVYSDVRKDEWYAVGLDQALKAAQREARQMELQKRERKDVYHTLGLQQAQLSAEEFIFGQRVQIEAGFGNGAVHGCRRPRGKCGLGRSGCRQPGGLVDQLITQVLNMLAASDKADTFLDNTNRSDLEAALARMSSAMSSKSTE